MQVSWKQWAVGAAVAGVLGAAGAARADFSYGYAQQTLSGLTITGTGLSNGTVTGSATTASAVAGGTGVATNSPTDALEAYQLSGPTATENNFTKYSTAGGGPQAGDFTRGDVVLGNRGNLFTSGANGSVVAESYASGTNGLETASGSWQLSATFTSTGSSVTVGYGFNNDIYTLVSGTSLSPAEAQFGAVISIKDQHGHEVDAIPVELATAFSSPPNGPEVITSGNSSATLSLAGLTPGDTYTVTINVQALSAAGAAVPEPASLGVLALGAAGLLGRRRR
jgi:hypothetical protein